MQFKIILFFVFAIFLPCTLSATTYYVSNTGNDANAGTSQAQAWRTTARVSAAHFQPGDRVLLAGGQVFAGGIWLRGNSQGTPAQPIVFRSYGAGRATIQSDSSYGFYAHNVAGIELRQLNFVGSGRLSNRNSGVVFYLDSANANLPHLRFDSLDVSGYRSTGLSIGSWNGTSGYTDVRITNCQLHANGEAGLSSYAEYPLLGHHNWYVGNCAVYDNAGRADITTTHTGNGIVLSGIDQALVEQCTAYHNGWLNANASGGPVGIWGWNCNRLTIQRCESHHNQSGTALDGGGFDLDGGCTNSVLQYNYSHDNQGPGYLLAQFGGAPAMHDLTVRYNISRNDARNYNQGAIELYSSGSNGGIVRAAIYNNSVLLDQPANGSAPKAVYVLSGGITDVTLRNNVLQTAAGLPVLATNTTTGLRLEGNCYWTPNAALAIDWQGTAYTSLAAWRAGTGQETLGAALRATGICADPAFAAPTATASLPMTDALACYIPRHPSALLGTGLSLSAEFGIDPGTRDFFGNPAPAPGTAGNIGAAEAQPAVVSATAHSAPADASAWFQVYPTVVRDEIRVVSGHRLLSAVSFRLFDMLGRECRTWSGPGPQLQAGGLVLPAAGLPQGRYVLHIQSENHSQRQSLVVAE
ncbi:hypothetical protein GCM10028822_37210 [Hymenobacter terrigena]